MPKMTKKWIDAGPLHLEILTSRILRSDSPKTRQAKKLMSSAAQKLLNDKRSALRLELDLAANYLPGDLVATLTFDDEHLPFRRRQVFTALKYFRKKLSAEYRSRGATLVMHSSIEHKHGDGRWHVHAVMNAADVDYQRIAELWGRGDVHFCRLLIGKHHDPDDPKTVKEYSYEGLAKYMTKERPDKPGDRCWTCTQSAKHPTIETALVDADTVLNPPKGARLLDSDKKKNQFCRLEYIKWIDAEPERSKTSKRRKKKN